MSTSAEGTTGDAEAKPEASSNGGLLYHEVQESKLCAVHCVNTVLQGPFFTEIDLAALASDLDRAERQVMTTGAVTGDFVPEVSHNVSLGGDFSIQVLQKALEVWDLKVIPLDSPEAGPAQVDPEKESAFICNMQNHWFCIRKVNGEWYNFDSLYAAPEHLSKFYFSAYLDTLKGCGWSIFLVRGRFPKESPMLSSEASGSFGQWLPPEEAEKIIKSCNSNPKKPPSVPLQGRAPDPFIRYADEDMLFDDEDEDFKAAIAASLLDSSLVAHQPGTSEAAAEALSPAELKQPEPLVTAARSPAATEVKQPEPSVTAARSPAATEVKQLEPSDTAAKAPDAAEVKQPEPSDTAAKAPDAAEVKQPEPSDTAVPNTEKQDKQ